MTTVLVIDNCSVFRFGIRALLETVNGLEVFTEQDNSLLVDEQDQQIKIVPDVLVISSCSSELTLSGLVGKYHQHFPTTSILVLLDDEDEICIHQLVENGVTSCLLRYEPATRLVEAICEAAKGERFFSQPLLSKLVTPLISPPTQDTPSLTKQELKVLRLVTEEKTNKEIAQLLQISERTVCNYLQSIRTKLDTQTTIAAVFRATQLGILPF